MSDATMPFAMEGCAMRHDPASAAVVVMLKALQMYGMPIGHPCLATHVRKQAFRTNI
jgi:hypothetical protein